MNARKRRTAKLGLAALSMTALLVGLAAPAEADPTYPLSGCPTISQGSQGSCVGALQYELDHYYGFSLAQDNDFGQQTEAAVVAFQTKAGIGVDGVVGPQTQAALYNDAQRIANNCQAVPVYKPNYAGGGLSDFGIAMDAYVMDPPDFSGTCTAYIQRWESSTGWQTISSVHTVPNNGTDVTTYTYWDGVGAKARVCVNNDGYVTCTSAF